METDTLTFSISSARTTVAPVFDWGIVNDIVVQGQEKSDEELQRNLDWLDSDHVRRISGAGRDTTGEEIVLSPRQDDLDIARLQHRGVSDIEE